jgi:hypothetical protein
MCGSILYFWEELIWGGICSVPFYNFLILLGGVKLGGPMCGSILYFCDTTRRC